MNIVGADTETHCVDFDVAPAPKLVCGSVYDDSGAHLMSRDEWLGWFALALADGMHVVFCNAPFDLGVAAAERPELLDLIFAALDEGRIHDVAIREALIDIARGELVERGDADDDKGFRYSLALLAERHLGRDLSAEKAADSWRTRYHELDGVPPERYPWAARVYPMRDAVWPVEICLSQEQLRDDPKIDANLEDEPRQVRAAVALQLARMWGLRTNRERVAALKAKVEAEYEAARAEFTAHGIYRSGINPETGRPWPKSQIGTKNTKLLQSMIAKAYGDLAPVTPGGGIATDRDTLLESGDPVLEKLGRSGKNDKRRSTYLPILERGLDSPWHPEYNVLVATGRVSSDAQQFPQDGGIRETFEPRPGCCYCSVDYGGLELRTMSQRAIWDPDVGFSDMAEALNAGRDCHTIAASSFMGISYEELLPRIKAKEDAASKFRALGKIFNFGKGGGMGAGAMAYNARAKDNVRFCLLTGALATCGAEGKRPVFVQKKQKMVCAVCIEISRKLGLGWLDAWREQAALFRKASWLTSPRGTLTDAIVPRSGRVRGQCGYTQWLNTPFQGLGADLVKDAMYRISREMYCDRRSPMWGGRIVLNVHDELVAEFKVDRAPEAGDRMAYIMRETAKEWLPDLGKSIEADPAISLILSKKMATIRDASGRLQLWLPEKKAA